MPIDIQFIGGAGTVTGSKTLISHNGIKLLVDCGLFQGLKELRLRNWSDLPVRPRDLDAVILTHAHLDHSGYIPLLVKKGFRSKIFSTEATRALCEILLPDSGHLQEEDAFFANKKKYSKHNPALPLYTEKEARKSLKYFRTVPFYKKIKMVKDIISARFFPAGHILGSAIVQLNLSGTVVTFTGDLGRQKNLILDPPDIIKETDYLVIESTYGDREHSNESSIKILGEKINGCFARGGSVLIPSFAVGRAQQILYLLLRLRKSRTIPRVPIYLDSPMAVRATEVFSQFTEEHNVSQKEIKEIYGMTKFAQKKKDSVTISESKESKIVISASGMATGGRVLHHLEAMAPDHKNLILFAGFQAKGTRGELLIHGAKEIKIHGESVPVNSEICCLDTLSAHADSSEIMLWLKNFERPPKAVFINHGEPEGSLGLSERIRKELGWNTVIPGYLEKFSL